MSNRETQFAGFAEKLYEELARNVVASDKGISDVEAFKQEQYRIIAQRAYDLVRHTLSHISPIELDCRSWDDCVSLIPDLTHWPEERL